MPGRAQLQRRQNDGAKNRIGDKGRNSRYALPMKSPFPGLDPYLEMHWGDVHHRLIQYASDGLQPGLPPDLVARVEERVFVETEVGSRRRMVPDVRVVQLHRTTPAPMAL